MATRFDVHRHDKNNHKDCWISPHFAGDITLTSHFLFFQFLNAQDGIPYSFNRSCLGSVDCEFEFSELRTFDRCTQDFDALSALRKLARLIALKMRLSVS